MPPKYPQRRPGYGKSNPKQPVAEVAKHGVEQNAIKKNFMEELEILDYNGKHNPKLYDDAKKKFQIYVMKTYGIENAQLFETGEEYFFDPLPEIDDDAFSAENDPTGMLKIERIELIKERRKNEREYEKNRGKIYGLIKGQCTNAMLHRIELADNYEEFDTQHNPKGIWDRIGDLLLTGAGEFRNDIVIRENQKAEYQKIKQFTNESIGDFYHRFLIELDSLNASGVEIGNEAEIAVQFLYKLDKNRFASLLTHLENASSMGHDEYPATVSDAMILAQN
jgi:hypothetical protein